MFRSLVPHRIALLVALAVLGGCATGSDDAPLPVASQRLGPSGQDPDDDDDEDDGTDESGQEASEAHADDVGLVYYYHGPCDPWTRDENPEHQVPLLPPQNKCGWAEALLIVRHEAPDLEEDPHKHPTYADLRGFRTPEGRIPRNGGGVISCANGIVEFKYCNTGEVCGLKEDWTYDCLPEHDGYGGTSCRDANYYKGACADVSADGVNVHDDGNSVVWCQSDGSYYYADCGQTETPSHCGDAGRDELGQDLGVYCLPAD